MPDSFSQPVCQKCHRVDPTACERGHIPMMAQVCDQCWDVVANEIAISEGAVDSLPPEPDPDEIVWFETPVPNCEKCGEQIQRRRTNYDRWVHLQLDELTAKEVLPEHRWRLVTLNPRHSAVVTQVIAVKVGAVEPGLGDPVYAAHSMFCMAPEATAYSN